MRTRIFFPVNNTDYLLVTNYRIIEFQSHGISRTVTDFLFCHEFSFFLSRIIELSNFVFTRNIADSHGFLSCPEFSNFRIFEFYLFVPRLVLGPTDRREVIIEFLSSVTFRDIPCD